GTDVAGQLAAAAAAGRDIGIEAARRDIQLSAAELAHQRGVLARLLEDALAPLGPPEVGAKVAGRRLQALARVLRLYLLRRPPGGRTGRRAGVAGLSDLGQHLLLWRIAAPGDLAASDLDGWHGWFSLLICFEQRD